MKSIGGKCRCSLPKAFGFVTLGYKVLGRSTVVTFHCFAVAIRWVSRPAEALARAAVSMVFSFPLQVGQHVRLSEERVATRGKFTFSFALSELSFHFSFSFSVSIEVV